MAAPIQNLRSAVTATPSSLLDGQLAYSSVSNTLFIGMSGSVIGVGGAGTFAPLASPTLTGTPLAPTAATATNTTQIATTAFVKAQAYLTGNQSITLSGDVSGIGTTAITTTINATVWAKLASPAFTGNPTAPTVSTADNSTNIATTAYVKSQAYITDNQSITLSGDVTGTGTTAITCAINTAVWAKLASPAFTGNPTAPTQSSSDNSTNIATTGFVKSLAYLQGNQTITISGDATGSGTTAIALTLDTVCTAGTYTKHTVNTKGLTTSGTTLSSSDIPQTLTSAWLTNFTTAVEAISLSSMTAPATGVSWNGQALTNLAAPVNPNDAATKNYVDTAVQGLDIKMAVAAATTPATGNITLSGLQTIDGYTTLAGDRVLVKNQTAPANNGIYVASATAWSRSADFNSTADIVPGSFIFVEQGVVNISTGWVLTSIPPYTIGTSSLTFSQFSGAGTYLAGNGLTLTGTSFSVVSANSAHITISGSGIDIASTYIGQASITTLGTITSGGWDSGTF